MGKIIFLILPFLLGSGIYATSNIQQQAQLSGVTFSLPVAVVISGFFATVVMILVMIFLQLITKTKMSIPLMLGNMILPGGSEKDKRTIGTTLHLLTGSVWGFVFGMLFQSGWLPDLNIILNGLFFGLALWLLLMLVSLPMMRKGLFGRSINNKVWIFTLIGHIAYGLFLGFIFPLIFLE